MQQVFFFGLLAINSEGVLLQYGEQRGRAVSGDSSFFFRVLQKEPVGGGEVCLRVGDSDFFEEPWRERKKRKKKPAEEEPEGGRRDGWSLKKIEKEAIFTLEEDYSGKFSIDS